jgi:hypothetical protein
MPNLTLGEWGNVAQIVATILALLGVAISMWVAARTLREIEHDRRLRHRPYLAFEPGGHRMAVEFSKRGAAVPGVNPAAAKRMLAHLPADGESVDLVWNNNGPDYGRLKNYGAGPALEVKVRWIAERVFIGGDGFEVTEEKRLEPLYGSSLNTMPTVPSHLEPGTIGQLSRIPAFIVKDYEKKITRVDGYFEITCLDIFREEHRVVQEFHLFTQYREQPPNVHVTFSALRSDEDAR